MTQSVVPFVKASDPALKSLSTAALECQHFTLPHLTCLNTKYYFKRFKFTY